MLHVDMDAFYASVELRDNPSLEGLPVCVGGPAASRGVIAAASYEARKYGIRSAMATATARRLCPDLVLLPPDFDKYTAVSRQIMEIFRRYTPLVEPLSLDEAFLDVTGSERLFGDAIEIGRRIRADILRETGLIASVGVAPTKFLAKLASDLDKPDGFRVILPDEVRAVLDPLPVSKIYGVGPRTAERLQRLGVRTVRDLASRPREEVAREFGASGTWIHDLASGIDQRRVTPRRDEKSRGVERTFSKDIADRDELRALLLSFCEEVAFHLRHKGLRGRTVTLKARFGDFRTVSRSKTLDFPTNLGPRLYAVTRELLEKVEARPLRLLGVQVSRLEDVRQPSQPTLFPLGAEPSTRADFLQSSEKLARATESLDKLRRRFGRDIVVPAALVGRARAARADGLEGAEGSLGAAALEAADTQEATDEPVAFD
ncbi:MAG: DNA polymerase IV [Planctomycetota bacterium]